MRSIWGTFIALGALVVTAAGAAPVSAAPGDLDTGFGAGGSFTAPFTTTFPGAEDAHGVAVDSQGRVYLSATEEAMVGGGAPRTIKVVRLSSQGALDGGFASGGTATLPTTGGVRHAGIVIDAQDRPLIAGYTGADNGSYQILLTRLTTAGGPDPDFGGGDGVVESGLPGSFGSPRPEGIGLTPDGKILVAGTLITAIASGFIARFESDGDPDTGYGTGGWTGIGDSGTQITALHVLAGGGAFVGGWDDYAEWVVAKLTPGGAPDNGFDGDGVARSSVGKVGTDLVTSYGMTADAQERPILVGQYTSSTAKLTVMRWTAGGAPDTSFGTGTPTAGALFLPSSVTGARGLDAAVDCAGKLLVTGGASRPPPANNNRAVLARLRDDGTLDSGFAAGAATPGVAPFDAGQYDVPTDLLLRGGLAYLAGFRRDQVGMAVTDQAFVARFDASEDCAGGPSPPAGPPVSPPVQSPATPPAKPADKPVTAALPVFSKLVTLPSAKKCVSRRLFRIRLRVPAGSSVVEATVTVNGKRVAVRKGSRLRSTVDLRKLPKGRFKVEVVLKLADGRKVRDNRRYKTCAPKRKASKR